MATKTINCGENGVAPKIKINVNKASVSVSFVLGSRKIESRTFTPATWKDVFMWVSEHTTAYYTDQVTDWLIEQGAITRNSYTQW